MKTRPGAALLVCLIALAGPAASDPLFPAALVFEPGYAAGPPAGAPLWAEPAIGSPLFIQGRVATVGAPFAALLPAAPYEITWAFDGATCWLTGYGDGGPCAGGPFAIYEGGLLLIYLDTTPDADQSQPPSFRNGELVLRAQVSSIFLIDDDPPYGCPFTEDAPDMRAYFDFDGGLWFDSVSNAGVGLHGVSEGQLDINVPMPLPYYVFQVDGTVDIYGTVAVEETTWGRVKALYR